MKAAATAFALGLDGSACVDGAAAARRTPPQTC